MSGTSLILTRPMPGPPETVWRLLVHPQSWWGEHVSLAAHVGGRFRETWANDRGRITVTSGTVTRCEPPALLELGWADDDWSASTVVRITLAGRAGGTELCLVHDGWDRLPAAGRTALMQAHEAGWNRHLDNLARALPR
jgi:uncharacterized protein YndB with AHSA1/START domain